MGKIKFFFLLKLNFFLKKIPKQVAKQPINGEKSTDYLYFSIFNLIFCSMVLGIPAFFFSIKAREQFRTEMYLKAQKNAKKSCILNIIGITLGSVFAVFLVIMFLMLQKI